MPSNQSTSVPASPPRLVRRLGLLLLGCLLLAVGDALSANLVDYVQDMIRLCGIAVIMAVSLNIVNGLTGQFSIGHAGFMSVGAYAGASATYYVQTRLMHNAPSSALLHAVGNNFFQLDAAVLWMLPSMLVAGLTAALFGYVVGVPSLRLRGDYLAIVTLGFGEIIRVLIENSQEIHPALAYLGGATGFSGESGIYSVPHLSVFELVFGMAALVILWTRNLKFSLHGLAFMSVREDEVAADAMGVNTTRIKVTAFVMSAFFAGVGGALYAHAVYFKPQTFGFILSMNYVIMVVLGGTGSITGATLAAIALTALPELLKPVQDRFHFGDEYRMVIYALMLVLMMLLRPTGVFGMGELNLNGIRRLFRRGGKGQVTTVGGGAENNELVTSVAPVTTQRGVAVGDTVVLDTINLTRRFGGLTAVGEVNLRLQQGELVGLIGPNGAGKTTLFNLLTGVYEPSEGQIDFNGDFLAGDRPLTGLHLVRRVVSDATVAGVGAWIVGAIVFSAIVPTINAQAIHTQWMLKVLTVVVGVLASLIHSARHPGRVHGLKPFQFAERGISRTFQNIRLFGELTVLENVRLATYCRRQTTLFDALFRTMRLEREEATNSALAQGLLARFNLLRLENETAKNLPYGDQRRLEIVRALATHPSLLLLDEPAAGMNPQEKVELMSLIRQIRDEFNLTILLIEHDMKLVMGICERIYVLDYGRVIAEGTPQEIRSNPKVIAAYLGEETPQESAAC